MSQWHKNKWQGKAEVVVTDTKSALQTLYNELNHGHRQKMIKNETVKTLFDRYGVEYGE